MADETEKKVEEVKITNEQMATLNRIVWTALGKPKWTKDDLVDFGKAIYVYGKKPLKEMDDGTWSKVFPFLKEITQTICESFFTVPTQEKKADEPQAGG